MGDGSMAQSEHLPIYKRCYELCLYLEQLVRGFSRYHKYGPGIEEEPAPLAAARRTGGFIAMTALFLLLVWFILHTIYSRMFVVEAISARVQGPVVVLRAPENGQFEASVNQAGPVHGGQSATSFDPCLETD